METKLSKETVNKLVLNSNALYAGSIIAIGYDKQKSYQSLAID